MDTGGLAQMTYNNFSPSGLGAPGAGFASRGKGSGLKRLNLASPPSVGPISENSVDSGTPRTSRSHLLAGLRTAARSQAVPASAPYQQSQHSFNIDTKYAGQYNLGYNQGVPQTATGSSFSAAQQYSVNPGQQVYQLPEQVLAPPSINYNHEDDMDPEVAAQLMAMQLHLAQRQQQLQQQLWNNTMQQMQTMGLNNNNNGARQPQTPVTPQMYGYNQQMQSSPIIQELPGQPGIYMVTNPLTGQVTYAFDNAHTQLSNSPPPDTPSQKLAGYHLGTPHFQVSPPIETERMSSPFASRSISPPKKTPSPPSDVVPLPPPSANAFRRGHKKAVSSLAFNTPANNSVDGGPKSAITRPVGFPQTPMTGTFGPGQARAGEHPIRQPRGPPPMEELKAAPTTKYEGSKNFLTRTRRQAVTNLRNAGFQRRVVRNGSAGSMTPASETDITFSVPSDNESDSGRSGSSSGNLSGRPSIGSLRAVANGAIGSERKASRERLNSNELFGLGEASPKDESDEVKPILEDRRKTPLLVLTNAAEKRLSSMY